MRFNYRCTSELTVSLFKDMNLNHFTTKGALRLVPVSSVVTNIVAAGAMDHYEITLIGSPLLDKSSNYGSYAVYSM